MFIAECDWSHPGDNRYVGNVAAAVAHYKDIPPPIRDVLVARVKAQKYDDVVTITKNEIKGKAQAYVGLRQMYFGVNKRCEKVVRPNWSFDRVERGLVYTEQGYTVLVPTVCGNVSRIDVAPAGYVAPAAATMPPPTYLKPKLGGQTLPSEVWRPTNTVPEPNALLLVVTAIVALIFIGRRTK